MSKSLESLREMLSEELDKIGRKKEIDQNDLCNVEKLAASIKNIDKIMLGNEMIEQYGYSFARAGRDGDGDGRYSERYSRAGYGNSRGNSMGSYGNSMNSYENYSREGNSNNYSRDNSNRSYDYSNRQSYERGYSGHYEQQIIDKMKGVIEDAEKMMR